MEEKEKDMENISMRQKEGNSWENKGFKETTERRTDTHSPHKIVTITTTQPEWHSFQRA